MLSAGRLVPDESDDRDGNRCSECEERRGEEQHVPRPRHVIRPILKFSGEFLKKFSGEFLKKFSGEFSN
jgi:hypothetical protein